MYIHYSTGAADSCLHCGGFRNRGSPFSEVPLYIYTHSSYHQAYRLVFSDRTMQMVMSIELC